MHLSTTMWQQLLSEKSDVVFYAPWGVSVDHRVVASILDGTVDVSKCIIYNEPHVNPEINTGLPVTAGEFTDRPDNWNILSRLATSRNEAIPTVWLNGIEKTPHNQDDWQNIAESLNDGHNRIFLAYLPKLACPLPVITVILSLFSAALQPNKYVRPSMRLHHAASLGWPNDRDEIPRDLQFIRQYHSSFSYFQEHGKRLWMTQMRDADSNEIIRVEPYPDRSDGGN